MKEKEIKSAIAEYERLILSKENRQDVELTRGWAKTKPEEAGVYAFFEKDRIVYVGETGLLQGRMNDIRNTLNHTLRRSIGEKKFSNVKGYEKASSKKKFPKHIEEKVENYLLELEVSILPVRFGRTEFEEYLVEKYDPIFNKKTKRGT